MKNDGKIWSYISVTGRKSSKEDPFLPKDDGTHTKQIVAVGSDLYILKESGNVWKYFIRPAEKNFNIVHEEFVLVDKGTGTKQISSSGAILYILKNNGIIWQYVPMNPKLTKKIYEPNGKDEEAIFIAADGGTLYFIKSNGSTWKYKERLLAIEKKEVAIEIDVVGGILYILTNEGEIIRYDTNDEHLRKLTEAGTDNDHIAAFGQDIFVIKKDGKGVWRYNEYIRKR